MPPTVTPLPDAAIVKRVQPFMLASLLARLVFVRHKLSSYCAIASGTISSSPRSMPARIPFATSVARFGRIGMRTIRCRSPGQAPAFDLHRLSLEPALRHRVGRRLGPRVTAIIAGSRATRG